MKKKQTSLLAELQKTIGYKFKSHRLLELALTHSSFKNEMKMLSPGNACHEDNERLEFLGDTVLSFVISKKLFRSFPDFPEGRLSKYRSILVSKGHLFKVAKELRLIHYLNLGKSEKQGRISDKGNILADSLEALIAALYLDGGMKNAERFILDHFGKYITLKRLSLLDRNYKSMLQEYAQRKYKVLPEYLTVFKKGSFHSTVRTSKSNKAVGTGKSKRDAEQNAAQKLLRKFKKKKPRK